MSPTSLATMAEIAKVNSERAAYWPDPVGGTLTMSAVTLSTQEGRRLADEAKALGMSVESDG